MLIPLLEAWSWLRGVFKTIGLAWTVAIAALLAAGWERHEAASESRTVSEMRTASATNHVGQVAVNTRPAIVSAALAETTDAQAPDYTAAVHAAVAAYARTHSVRLSDAGSGTAGVCVPDRASSGDLGAAALAAEPETAVPTTDLDALADDHRWRAQVQPFLQALVASGYAVVEPPAPALSVEPTQ